MSGQVISQRALNRATLARQLLLSRAALQVPDALERLVGIQAQTATTWYTGLWSRLEGFAAEDASRLLESRELVRIALMRSTLHLVTAEDALALRPLLQPAVERPMQGRGRTELREHGLEQIAHAGRKLLEEKPLTNAELGRRLAERWPAEDPSNLVMGVRVAVPLVQVPPRGMWRASGAAAHAPLESWLGRPLERRLSREDLVLRYLGAFGPATPADAQVWSGLTGLQEIFERMRSRLCVRTDEHGRELFDVPGAPRPDPAKPAPPRFLYDFDNLLLSHADRSRFISDDRRAWMLSVTQRFSYGALLVDGFVSGVWRIEREGERRILAITVAARLPKRDREAVAKEGERLLAFWEPDARERDVWFGTTDDAERQRRGGRPQADAPGAP